MSTNKVVVVVAVVVVDVLVIHLLLSMSVMPNEFLTFFMTCM